MTKPAMSVADQVRMQAAAFNARLARNPRVQFANWLSKKFPQVYADAAAKAEQRKNELLAKAAGVTGGGQLGQFDLVGPPAPTTADKSIWEKFLDGAITAGTAYLTLQQQKELLQMNIERAKQGLAPIDPSIAAPIVKTQVDIDPQLAKDLTSNIGAGISKTLLIVGGAVIALLLFMRK